MNKSPYTPEYLYKYTKAIFAKSMISGEFYINTFENLRNYEETHSGIGDKEEGTKTTYADKVNFHTSQSDTFDEIPDFAKKWIDAPGCKIVNGTFIQKTRENFYVFSCSKTYNREIMKKLGYDSCIQISEPNIFFREITNTMQDLNLTEGDFFSGECNYQAPRKEHYKKPSNIHPAIIKPERYAYQQEVRVIWIPPTPLIEPKKITTEEARKYIKIIV